MKGRDDATQNPSTRKMLDALNVARFRMTRRSATGYEVGDVDAFIDKLIRQVQSGRPVLPVLRKANFRTAPQHKGSYLSGDVDAFLERVQSFARGDESAFDEKDEHNPMGTARWPAKVGFVLAMVLLVVIAAFMILGT